MISKMFARIRKDMRPLLDDSFAYILEEANGKMKATYKQFVAGKSDTWGYIIHPSRALTFKNSERPTQENRVDVYCDIQWTDNALPIKQDIKVRVWGVAEDLIYRSRLDSDFIHDKLTDPDRIRNGRVISRYHFDKVNHQGNSVSEEYHPLYHVQIGGKAEPDELCWHPSSFDIPRIPHHPMDFFLVCQLVAINFFPKQYRVIKKSAEWNTHLETTQKILLSDYYKSCIEAIENGKSLLDELS
jgi:hypothetical protein